MDFDGNTTADVPKGMPYFLAGGMTYSPLNQVETVEFGNNTKATMSYDDINHIA